MFKTLFESHANPLIPEQAFAKIVLTTLCLSQTYSASWTQSNNPAKQSMQQNNPLRCDPGNGMCELPNNEAAQPTAHSKGQQARIVYFTDPICSSCWGIEPQLRRLKLEYGQAVAIEYRMGGLLPDWSYNSGGISKPSDVAKHWDEVSSYYNMPMDGDVWLEDPLSSSYPPSIAFKAAQLQDPKLAIQFLRRIREMVFIEKKNITKWEFLKAAAVECGLNPMQLKTAIENEGKLLFEEDLQLAKKMGVRGFPTLFIFSPDNQYQISYGTKPYASIEQLLLVTNPTVQKTDYNPELNFLFREFSSLTTCEFTELSGLQPGVAIELLEKAAEDGILKKEAIKNGTIWKSIYLEASEN